MSDDFPKCMGSQDDPAHEHEEEWTCSKHNAIVEAEYVRRLERGLGDARQWSVKLRNACAMLVPLERILQLLNGLDDRLNAVRDGEGWSPIETAPKGVDLLLYGPPRNGGYTIGGWFRDTDCWTDGEIELHPTHWMPLPDGPKAVEK